MVHWNAEKTKRWLQLKLAVSLLTAMALIVVNASSEASDHLSGDLRITRQDRIPLGEVSGFALRDLPGGGRELLSVGDREARVWVQPLAVGLSADARTGAPPAGQAIGLSAALAAALPVCAAGGTTPVCSKLIEAAGSQWEGAAVDGAGRIFLLQESTDTIVVFSDDGQTLLATLSFDLARAAEGRKGETDRGTRPGKKHYKSLGEGLVLMKAGHILVAKEATPPILVEFGPEGDAPLGFSAATMAGPADLFPLSPPAGGHGPARLTLVPLATWTGGAEMTGCDLSELASDRNGHLHTLSQKCRQITEYAALDPAVSRIEPLSVWRLPKRLARAEALVILEPGTFLVGNDVKSTAKPNLFELRPALAE